MNNLQSIRANLFFFLDKYEKEPVTHNLEGFLEYINLELEEEAEKNYDRSYEPHYSTT